MNKQTAQHLAALLQQTAAQSGGPFHIQRIEYGRPLKNFHAWADGKSLVSADRVAQTDGQVLFVVLIDWQRTEEYYCVTFPEDHTRPLSEIWRTKGVGRSTVLDWQYKPMKRDGRNEERVERFRRRMGDTRVTLALPGDIQQTQAFLSELFALVQCRLDADELVDRPPPARVVTPPARPLAPPPPVHVGAFGGEDGADGLRAIETPSRRSRVQGYEPDPDVRRAVERRAMALAEEHYRSLGFDVQNMATTKPYDFRCMLHGLEVRVEVKGTRGDGAAIEVTIGEVENARGVEWRTDLFVVSGIVVTRSVDNAPVASSGTVRIVAGWRPAPEDLEGIRFRCLVR